MTQKPYDNIIDENPSTLAKWIRYVTKLRLEDIGNTDAANKALATLTASAVAYDPTTSGMAATQVQAAIDELRVYAVANLQPPGAMMVYGGTVAPTGWLLCFGQSLLRADYPALFTAIGTTYGAADGTHFNVPDIRGRVVAGQDDMGGSSANRLTGLSGGVDGDVLGGTGGEESHVLVTAELAAHQHASSLSQNGGEIYGTGGSFTAGQGCEVAFNAIEGGEPVALSSSVGSDTAHNNVQPTIILNYIIKT